MLYKSIKQYQTSGGFILQKGHLQVGAPCHSFLPLLPFLSCAPISFSFLFLRFRQERKNERERESERETTLNPPPMAVLPENGDLGREAQTSHIHPFHW